MLAFSPSPNEYSQGLEINTKAATHMGQEKTQTFIKEVFDTLDKLSQRPFEYFISGLGFILVFFGIFFNPVNSITQQELWAISFIGFFCLLSGLILSLRRTSDIMRINLEKLEYKKFLVAQKTKRLIAANQEHYEPDFSDIESEEKY